ncbi:MAG: hypothetical protein ACREQ9_15105 [Candidatus Binatia bacterium]
MADAIPRRSIQQRPEVEEKSMQLNDIRDLYTDTDTLFVVTVISDAMRRGVRHFKLDGTPLARLNDIVDALAEDGEVLMDMDGSQEDPKH